MCLIADQKHMTDLKRSKIMGLVMGSIALGVLVGYPFGSILYDFVNKSTPFNVIICAIALNLGMFDKTFQKNSLLKYISRKKIKYSLKYDI